MLKRNYAKSIFGVSTRVFTKHGETCAYRGKGGLKCAVGYLISNEEEGKATFSCIFMKFKMTNDRNN